jgi:hypothetical protein
MTIVEQIKKLEQINNDIKTLINLNNDLKSENERLKRWITLALIQNGKPLETAELTPEEIKNVMEGTVISFSNLGGIHLEALNNIKK